LSWDPKGDGKTVIRGGYGIVYTVNSNNVYGEGETVALRQTSISVTKPSYPDPYNGLGYQHYLSTTAPSVTVNDNDVSNPPVYTYSLGGTRELRPDLALIVDGFYSKMTKFQISEEINKPDPVTGLRADPAYHLINEFKSDGNYEYKALLVRLEKRYSHHVQFDASYTLAKQRDNYSNSGTRTNIYEPGLDEGDSAADRRNMLVLSSYTQLPWGITVGGIYSVRSSLPLVAQTGIANNDNLTTDYVPGTTKNEHNVSRLLAQVNSWRITQPQPKPNQAENLLPIPQSQIQSSFYNQLDMHINKNIHLSERYRLQVIGQLFNVLGTDNFGGVGSTQQANASASSFGTISSALPRQQGELALRFLF
jgi:hypothetical protein